MSARQSLLALLLLALAGLVACATGPKNLTEGTYAAGQVLIAATNSVADLHEAGMLKGADYEKAKDVLNQATAAYGQAKQAVLDHRPQDAQSYLRLAQSLLNQLAGHLIARGR